MAVTLTGFSEYIKANTEILIDAALKASNAMSMDITTFDDVKYKAEKPLKISSNLKLNTGNPSAVKKAIKYGDGTGVKGSELGMTPVEVEDKQLTFVYQYSTYDFDKAITAAKKKQGSMADDDVYLAAFVDLIVSDMYEVVDFVLMQGDTSKSDNQAVFDGWLKKIVAGATVKTGTAPAKLTSTTAVTAVNRIIDKYNESFPKLIKKKKRLFMSNYDFQVAVKAFNKLFTAVDKNTIVVDAENIQEYKIPGTNVWLTGMDGLDGLHEFFMCRPVHLIAVTDSKTEDSKVNSSYDEQTGYYYIDGVFKLGAQIADVKEIVLEKV